MPAAGPEAADARGFGPFGAGPGGPPNADPGSGDGAGSAGGAGGPGRPAGAGARLQSGAAPAPDGAPPAGFGFGPGGNASSAVIDYLTANRGSAQYLVATTDSNTAAPIILATGEPVMSLGGFSGSDPILSVDQFASLVSSGQVRYVLLGRGGRFGGPGATSEIISWVESNGSPVAIAGSQTQLYELGK